MKNARHKIAEILIRRGKQLLNDPYKKEEFTKNPEANNLLDDIDRFPHAFLLGCIMDRQMKAEKAWLIPYEVSREIGGFEFSRLLKISQKEFKRIFKQKRLHRFNDIMAENFYFGIQKIHKSYNNDASNIWKRRPKSATVVKRFLEFKGVGIKIATMAANILVRKFRVPLSDYICIDVSPDTHVVRVFKRLGFISTYDSKDELIYSARELNPKYPGIFDLSCWEIGRNWCGPQKVDCKSCYLNLYCPKNI